MKGRGKMKEKLSWFCIFLTLLPIFFTDNKILWFCIFVALATSYHGYSEKQK